MCDQPSWEESRTPLLHFVKKNEINFEIRKKFRIFEISLKLIGDERYSANKQQSSLNY